MFTCCALGRPVNNRAEEGVELGGVLNTFAGPDEGVELRGVSRNRAGPNEGVEVRGAVNSRARADEGAELGGETDEDAPALAGDWSFNTVLVIVIVIFSAVLYI